MRLPVPARQVFEGACSRGVGRLLGGAAALRIPAVVLEPLVAAYVAWFGVDLSQALVPAGGFGSFGAFFARRLRPDVRPVCGTAGAVVSPCDGVMLGRGRVEAGTTGVLVVKGTRYRVPDLIADPGAAAGLAGGGYCLFYLHPRDYHRVHVPLDAVLREVRHIPGARYPVAPWAARFAAGALGKNERVAFDLELPSDGRRCVLVMVAAFGVGNIECRHAPPRGGRPAAVRRTGSSSCLRRGDELGAFRLGSTVALLWPRGAIRLDEAILDGARVLAGQRIGQIDGSAPGGRRAGATPAPPRAAPRAAPA